MMNKVMCKFSVLLFGCLLQQNVSAAFIEIGSRTSELIGIERVVDVRTFPGGALLDTGIITNWSLSYDDVTDDGELIITAFLTSAPSSSSAFEVTSTSLSANANGSLRVVGGVNVEGFGVVPFSGDIAVTVDTDFVEQTTLFTLNLLEILNTDQKGLLIETSLVGSPFDIAANFELFSGLSSIVGNPFPIYSSVPVPAAVWLLGSGLLGLVAMGRKKYA